ncbi:hypothetical protein V1477_015503 [Vespula maculifrons]|uniref:Uncharacterized protein n=1 Tax=Vespula maculifrons TaxID=7453 RepID=A0ABD2BGA4_VESMC
MTSLKYHFREGRQIEFQKKKKHPERSLFEEVNQTHMDLFIEFNCTVVLPLELIIERSLIYQFKSGKKYLILQFVGY